MPYHDCGFKLIVQPNYPLFINCCTPEYGCPLHFHHVPCLQCHGSRIHRAYLNEAVLFLCLSAAILPWIHVDEIFRGSHVRCDYFIYVSNCMVQLPGHFLSRDGQAFQ